ncbi:hypothetical protein BGX38DRAFT_1239844 [Terfezia claveryi]|nr:hypothetical protein BGX38DRAFT_1239844 [Terfezia claveryi]
MSFSQARHQCSYYPLRMRKSAFRPINIYFPATSADTYFQGCTNQQNTRARAPPLFTGMTHNADSQ